MSEPELKDWGADDRCPTRHQRLRHAADGRSAPAAARPRSAGRSDAAAVSVISFYEIGLKVRLGKWPEMADHLRGLEAQAREDGYDVVPLNPGAALAATMLDWAPRDPFDQLIAAVASLEDLPRISSDTAFDALDLKRVCY